MTSEELRIAAQTISGLTLDSVTSFNWVKSAISDIARDYHTAAPYATPETTTTTTENQVYTLQKELILLDKVISDNCLTNELELHRNVITFYNPGTYEIRYYCAPTVPAANTEAIDLPGPFAEAIKFLLASKIRARLFGQGDSNAVSFFQEYTAALEKANAFMNRRNSRRRRMPPAYRY